jgi:hypothetical protein
MKLSPGVNLSTFFRAAFARADPKSAKKTDNLTVFLYFLGSVPAKAACKTLIKSTPGDEIWLSFVAFPHDMSYFLLNTNNTNGISSTDVALYEKEIILRDKESAPCKFYSDQVILYCNFYKIKITSK